MPAANASNVATRNQTDMAQTSDRELTITRTFNGPARIVFDAWTKPEFVKRWWAPKSRGVSIVGCDANVRVGGKYRYLLRTNDGQEIAFSGVYSEVTPHTRLAYTNVFEPMAHAGHAEVTITFEEKNGKTHLTSRELYPSKEVLDQVLSSGMESGMRECMDQLDELVASLA